MPPIGTLGSHLLSHLGLLPWLLLSQSAYTLRFIKYYFVSQIELIPYLNGLHRIAHLKNLQQLSSSMKGKVKSPICESRGLFSKIDLFGSHIYVIFPSNSLAFWLIRITLVSLLHKCLWSQNQRVCFESLNFLDLRMTPQVVLSCCYRIQNAFPSVCDT